MHDGCPSSSLNIIPVSILEAIRVPGGRVIKQLIEVFGFEGNSRYNLGFVHLDVTIWLIRATNRFHAVTLTLRAICCWVDLGFIVTKLSPPPTNYAWRPFGRGGEFTSALQNPFFHWTSLISWRLQFLMSWLGWEITPSRPQSVPLLA